ncbi:hypothetical protein [Arthrobacter antibioticus]|uniref:hypothetical protein n=1 Tax=Arthrobacter sp. H35-MC1 TaxID=3046203 RepID=UPI0024B9BC1C|nr:hypothetical protein [Arthrobacter sp. H35-MC1]MDJ0317169.1 hypothetical protein [Arthrobacter sp. H35-MC1]
MSPRNSAPKRSVDLIVSSLGGTARRKTLLAHGATDWTLHRALDTGMLALLAPGLYALPGISTLDSHLALNQATRDCLSRAQELGLWVLQQPAVPHVATAHGRDVPGCVVHRVKGRLTLWDVLRHCVQCGTEIEALCVMESAVVLKKCTIAELRGAFIRSKDAQARRIIAMIDPQTMSIAETCARYHLRQGGYNVQCQVKVPGVGHLDALVDGVLGLEIDGEQYHNNSQAWEEDLRRGNVLVIRGIPTLRIKASIALYRPEVLLDWVHQALTTMTPARRRP